MGLMQVHFLTVTGVAVRPIRPYSTPCTTKRCRDGVRAESINREYLFKNFPLVNVSMFCLFSAANVKILSTAHYAFIQLVNVFFT